MVEEERECRQGGMMAYFMGLGSITVKILNRGCGEFSCSDIIGERRIGLDCVREFDCVVLEFTLESDGVWSNTSDCRDETDLSVDINDAMFM